MIVMMMTTPTSSVVQCPFQKSDGCSVGQEISHLLWNLKVCYHVHKGHNNNKLLQ